MKTLSLLQPWASLVVTGKKKIETRSWRTSYRGELFIHASLGKKAADLTTGMPFRKYIPRFSSLPFGAIVGKVLLEDVIEIERLQLSDERINSLTLEEKAFGDYSGGRYAWLLSNPVEFAHPIPMRGSLNLWDYKGDGRERAFN